jgi:hypothetical protein
MVWRRDAHVPPSLVSKSVNLPSDDFRPAIALISQDMGRRLAMTVTMISGVALDGVVQAPARTRTHPGRVHP